jgi:cystathionine beta-lyase
MSREWAKGGLETELVHPSHAVQRDNGAVSVPIYHASTFHQFDPERFGPYDYSRSGNPTRAALEETIAQLEGGLKGFAFSSGMAAISTAFLLLSKGDHILISEDVYGGTHRLVTKVLHRFGIEYTFVDMTDEQEISKQFKRNTRLLYVETPSNPLLQITDLSAICALAKERDCLTFVDNTFCTPLLQRPLAFGADVVLHSATKFLAGHSDVLAGLAVVQDERLAEQLGFLQNTFGAVLGVQDCWLVLRGLKTLHVRLKQAQESAQKIAEYLQSVPAVRQVFYPGLPDHVGSDLHRKQAAGPGAVLSFRLNSKTHVEQFVRRLTLPVFAVSLGAVESILSYPARMSHAALSPAEREKRGIDDALLRLSVGLENADDLICDLEQAFQVLESDVYLTSRSEERSR